MDLKRTPAERLLLAQICFRAGGSADGLCRDSNRVLASWMGVHLQSVSDMVKRLSADKLIVASVDPSKANERTLQPISDLLIPYQKRSEDYKRKTDRSKSNADSKPEDYKPNADSTMSETLIGSKPNADSTISESLIAIYKEEKTSLEKEENSFLENQQQPDSASLESEGDGGEENAEADSSEKKEEAGTPPQPLPTAETVRAELGSSAPHRRYAVEQIKVAKTDAEYAELIELYITQQEMQAEAGKPTFPEIGKARRHFMNWLGKRTEFKTTSNGNPQNPKSAHANPTGQGAILPSGAGYRKQIIGRSSGTSGRNGDPAGGAAQPTGNGAAE